MMSKSFRVAPQATLELFKAADWYDAQRQGLGKELVAEVYAAYTTIAANPEAFRLYFDEARRYTLKRFSYSIYYTSHQGITTVVAIYHNKQNAAEKLKRRRI